MSCLHLPHCHEERQTTAIAHVVSTFEKEHSFWWCTFVNDVHAQQELARRTTFKDVHGKSNGMERA